MKSENSFLLNIEENCSILDDSNCVKHFHQEPQSLKLPFMMVFLIMLQTRLMLVQTEFCLLQFYTILILLFIEGSSILKMSVRLLEMCSEQYLKQNSC